MWDVQDPNKSKFSVSGSRSHVGDFAATLEVVLRKRASKSTGLTLKQVNQVSAGRMRPCMGVPQPPMQLLDRLYTEQEQTGKDAVLNEIIRKCSAQEQKWIVRVILKDLKIGLRHERVLKFYHPDAMDAYVHATPRGCSCG